MRGEDLKSLFPQDERRAGAILGLAVGDALGATYEFCSPEETPDEPLEMIGGGWLGLKPGETTDDTALARAVLEGYEENGALDLHRVREAMLRWQDTDPKDIGNQTRKALDYLRVHLDVLSLPEEPDAQSNGAVMRAASHGLMARSPEEAVENAWVEAALTHPSEIAKASSALVAGATAYLIEGKTPANAVETSFSEIEHRMKPSADLKAVFRLPEIEDVLEVYSSDHERWGWTVYTTRLGLGFLLRACNFRSGLEEVVRLGGDADTNGAVAGALLGARFGVGSIPPEWLRDLKRRG